MEEKITNTVLIEKQGEITIIKLNRPNVMNAVNPATAKLLAEAFIDFENDTSAKVAILSGENGTFCAGADLKAVSQGEYKDFPDLDSPIDSHDPRGPMGPTYLRLTKPVIAAISGYAVAGGLELSLWCDMRVVEEDAVLGVFCRRWGVPLIDGGTVRLPRLIGHSNAMDLILTGRAVDASEAKTMGLANRVVKKGHSLKAAMEIATQLCQFPQECMKNDRASAYAQWDLSFDDAMVNELTHGRRALHAGETVSGAKRFSSGHGRGGSFGDI